MTYKLKNHDRFFVSNSAPIQLLHDDDQKPELDAQVASKDYFALLATQLDSVSQSLEATNHSDYVRLECLVSDLLYLHEHYVIRKK